MSGIRIISRNENGARAIRKHREDSRKESLRHRMLYRQAFVETFSEEPAVVLTIRARQFEKYMGPAAIEPIAVEMMSENGATPDDYYIEVVE